VTLASLVVLGCRVGREGKLSTPAERRVRRAALAFGEGMASRILVCGGKRWHGVSEADAFASALNALGVPGAAIDRELVSRSTLQNARCAAKLLLLGQRSVGVVTCDWHMPRALHCFRSAGFDPTPIPARAPELPLLATRARALREWCSYWLDALTIAGRTKV
jgi:uncharacterized SAM-binding protein YcdF (DUF218 family)